ncbi:MAG: glucosamine-6-phosphate deaminase [Candidatus Ornithospirochaeta sp.]
MNLIVTKDYKAMSAKGADIISALLTLKRNCVLGLATGSTPVGMYTELASRCRDGKISFSDVTTVNLDEYYPLPPENDQSYRYFMNDKLFDHVDIDKSRTHVLYGLAEDPEKECREYEEMIDSLGGIDLQVLGIGRNGHIGFNEPGDFLYPRTHKTSLTESTIEANSRFFSSSSDVPRFSLTMGIGTILKARKILVLASGPDKKDAVSRMLSDTIDTRCPATLLSLHSDVTVIVTEDCV